MRVDAVKNPALLARAGLERLRVSLWFAPAVSIVLAHAAATALSDTQVPPESWAGGIVFAGGAESARQLMATVAGSMITVTGVVFTLTVVALQIASGQYSPRVLRSFLRDPANQLVLGVFLATFAWAVAVLPTIRVAQQGQEEYVPRLAVTLGTALVGLSLALLVFFIHRLTTSIRVESIMRTVRLETLDTLGRVHPTLRQHADQEPARPDIPDTAEAIPLRRSGYLQAVDERRLMQVARKHDVVIMIHPLVGAHLVEGTLLGYVWPARHAARADEDMTAAVDQAVQLGFERTMQQDVGFGVRQLTDIAVKALSPGINDPTTAVDAVSHLSVIMAALAQHSLDHRLYQDDSGTVRVGVPRPTFDEYLDMCVGQIRRYGSAEPAVLMALLRLLKDVATVSSAEEVDAALQRQADVLVSSATRDVAEPSDLDGFRHLKHEFDQAVRTDAADRPLAHHR